MRNSELDVIRTVNGRRKDCVVFSDRAMRRLEAELLDFRQELEEQCLHLALREGVDDISECHVRVVAECLVRRPARARASVFGSVGCLLLGAGISLLLQLLRIPLTVIEMAVAIGSSSAGSALIVAQWFHDREA